MKVDMKRFVGQVAVVTGGAKGIGGACAERFAQEGANVACLDVVDEVNAQHAADLQALGVDAVALHCDVADPESIKAAVETVVKRWKRIDILVAAAGIYTGSPLTEVSFRQWQRLIDIDLTGVFLSDQAVAPTMMKQRAGSIINIASMAGKTSWSASAEYSSAKSGVIGLTRAVAMDMAPYLVTVNAICPGNTVTDMVKKDVAPAVGGRDGVAPDEWLRLRANDCPLKRMAEPWEMAGVAAFLASADARYITGQSLEVDGGMIMS
jgi:NAD(P)-dependent dehydrogenase (short-subunit alcohol dehydrogenase family)